MVPSIMDNFKTVKSTGKEQQNILIEANITDNMFKIFEMGKVNFQFRALMALQNSLEPGLVISLIQGPSFIQMVNPTKEN